MQYMLLIHTNAARWAEIPEPEAGAILRDFGTFIQDIVRSGHMRGGARLHPASTATTVRRDGDKVLTTDGPFTETREYLGGFVMVECKDLDEALAIARRIPSIRAGDAIEVRPVMSTPESVARG